MPRLAHAPTRWLVAVLLGVAAIALPRCAAGQNDFEMTEQQFNSWITNDGTTPEQFLQTQLDGRLARLNVTCALTDTQRKRLELAGRGDIVRFQNQVAPLREELVGKFFDQNNLNDVYQRIQPLAQRIRKGVLNEGSLFAKVMATTLDDQQRLAYDSAMAEQVRYQYRAKLKLLIATFESSAPMIEQQRRDLLALLLKSTRPPKRFNGQYDWYYVQWQVSTVPHDDVWKILDPAQRVCFEQAVQRGGQYRDMLEREGMVPADQPPEDSGDDDVPEIEIGP